MPVLVFTCLRCSHNWGTRAPHRHPRICPRCKSASWHVPKKPKASPTLADSTIPLHSTPFHVAATDRFPWRCGRCRRIQADACPACREAALQAKIAGKGG